MAEIKLKGKKQGYIGPVSETTKFAEPSTIFATTRKPVYFTRRDTETDIL